MKCEEWLPLIEEYVDGELDQPSTRRTAEHIRSCASCHSDYDALRREQEVYSNYRRDIEVSPALWATVSSRIQAQKSAAREGAINRIYRWLALTTGGPRLSPALAVLLISLAVAATIVTMRYLGRPDRAQPQKLAGGPSPSQSSSITAESRPGTVPSPEPTATAGPAHQTNSPGTGVEPGIQTGQIANQIASNARHTVKAGTPAAGGKLSPEQVVRRAEENQLAAIAVLNKEINRRRSDLDPALVAKFQVALTAVDLTIAETRHAVHDHPGDPVAAQYMLAAYAEKIEVLKEIAGQ
jgi:anti-sigma factor RsiW